MNPIKLFRSTVGKNNTKIIKALGNTFAYKDILKKHGAKYDKFGKYWFWWANREDEQTIIDKYIKPALAEIKETNDEFISDIDAVIDAIMVETPSSNPEIGITKEQESDIKDRLVDFKKMLTNIENDEEFKDIMKKLITIKAAQGRSFSLLNSLLIFIQNRNAGVVMSKTDWLKYHNRILKSDAKPLLIWAPTGRRFAPSKEKIEKLKVDYYKKIGKKEGDALTPKEKFQLDNMKKGGTMASGFKIVPVYSQYDTKLIEGAEDYLGAAEKAQKEIKWFEDNMISDEVRPVYKGLISFAEDNGLKIELVDDLGGARGVSKSGAIEILKNEGNDVGLTKTLAHEISHELLHQEYLKKKGNEASKFHIGRINRSVVEQQAELSAWMFMYSFGFDVKTTSLNYTVLWGGDKDNMVKVFNTVSSVVNYLIDQINARMKKITEDVDSGGKHITPEEIASLLGVENEYNEIKQKESLGERIRSRLNLI